MKFEVTQELQNTRFPEFLPQELAGFFDTIKDTKVPFLLINKLVETEEERIFLAEVLIYVSAKTVKACLHMKGNERTELVPKMLKRALF